MTHGPQTGDTADGPQGRLSRERVLTAALDLVDREGLAALTMRRLGAELGVEAMSLYHYAPGKNALLDGVVEALYVELEDHLAAGRPAAGSGPAWRAELHRIALATYQVCLDHPEGTLLIFSRMTRVPLARRPPPILRDHERVLALLREAGYGPAHSARIWRAFTGLGLGIRVGGTAGHGGQPQRTRPSIPARSLPHPLPGAVHAPHDCPCPGGTGWPRRSGHRTGRAAGPLPVVPHVPGAGPVLLLQATHSPARASSAPRRTSRYAGCNSDHGRRQNAGGPLRWRPAGVARRSCGKS